jgi:hypothetical protein
MNKLTSYNRLAFTALLIGAMSVTLLAQSTGSAKGKVRTPRGTGIPGATITARQKGVDVSSTTADSKGAFTMTELTPGRYNFAFEAKGYSTGVLYNIEINKNKTADLGDRLILTPDQGEQIIVKGSVFTKEGYSLPGARIEVEKVAADGTTRKLGSTFTSSEGEFTFRPDTSAKLRFTATYKGISASKDLDVDDPAIYRLAIALDLSSVSKQP